MATAHEMAAWAIQVTSRPAGTQPTTPAGTARSTPTAELRRVPSPHGGLPRQVIVPKLPLQTMILGPSGASSTLLSPTSGSQRAVVSSSSIASLASCAHAASAAAAFRPHRSSALIASPLRGSHVTNVSLGSVMISPPLAAPPGTIHWTAPVSSSCGGQFPQCLARALNHGLACAAPIACAHPGPTQLLNTGFAARHPAAVERVFCPTTFGHPQPVVCEERIRAPTAAPVSAVGAGGVATPSAVTVATPLASPVDSPRNSAGFGRNVVRSHHRSSGSPGIGHRRDALVTPRAHRASAPLGNASQSTAGQPSRSGGHVKSASTTERCPPGNARGATSARRKSAQVPTKASSGMSASTRSPLQQPLVPTKAAERRSLAVTRAPSPAPPPVATTIRKTRTSMQDAVGRLSSRHFMSTRGPLVQQGLQPENARGRMRSPTNVVTGRGVDNIRAAPQARSASPPLSLRRLRVASIAHPAASPTLLLREVPARAVSESPPRRQYSRSAAQALPCELAVPDGKGIARTAALTDVPLVSPPIGAWSGLYVAESGKVQRRAASVSSLPQARSVSPGSSSRNLPAAITCLESLPRSASLGMCLPNMRYVTPTPSKSMPVLGMLNRELAPRVSRSPSPPSPLSRSPSPSLSYVRVAHRTLSPSASEPQSHFGGSFASSPLCRIPARHSMPQLGLGCGSVSSARLLQRGSGSSLGPLLDRRPGSPRQQGGEGTMFPSTCFPSSSSLQKDGPSLPPFFYEADPDDAMDAELLQELVALNLEVSARLNIKRVQEGEYDIEGVRTSLYWHDGGLCVRATRSSTKKRRRSKRRHESGDGASDEGEVLRLATYLRQVANVDVRHKPTNSNCSDDLDAVVAAFACITGGAGLTGSFAAPRPKSPSNGGSCGSGTVAWGGALGANLSTALPGFSPSGSMQLSQPPFVRVAAPGGLAGQAMVALGGLPYGGHLTPVPYQFGGHSTPVPYRGGAAFARGSAPPILASRTAPCGFQPFLGHSSSGELR